MVELIFVRAENGELVEKAGDSSQRTAGKRYSDIGTTPDGRTRLLEWGDDRATARADEEAAHLAAAPARLKSYLAAKRYAVETSGITVSGVEVPTDRDSVATIKVARDLVREGLLATIPFKAKNGFVTMNQAALDAVVAAIAAHVQACFAKEADLAAAIDAGTVTTAAAIDGAAWPGSS